MADAGDARPARAAVASPGMADPPRSRLWPAVFAAIYDPVLSLGELAGLRGHRRRLLAQARGRVLELGAGTGLNLPHYPDGLDTLILVEPDAAMRRRLARRLAGRGRSGEIVDAVAERLPLPDRSVDTVVATLVLCTVEDPERALAEIARVLRPDGQLLFVEHVRSRSSRLARMQDALAGPWRRFACGCRCNRSTVEQMRACGFTADAAPATWRAMPPIVRPLVIGRARPRPAAA
jgi:SAM-dependent methyltransferase